MPPTKSSPFTPLRRGSHTMLSLVQLSLIVNFVIIVVIGTRSFDRATASVALAITGLLVAVSIVATMVPWSRLNRRLPVVIGVLDLVAIAAMRETVFDYERGLLVVAVIPVVWLSFFFGRREVVLGLLGSYVVAIIPFVTSGSWTATVTDTGAMLLSATTVTAIGISVHAASVMMRKQNVRLLNARSVLRASRAADAAMMTRLRESVEAAETSKSALLLSVAFGVDSAEKLRDAIDAGATMSEALKQSVADRLDAASAALTVMDTVESGITFYNPEGVVVLANSTALALSAVDDLEPIAGMNDILAKAVAGDLVTRHAFWVGSGAAQRSMLATSKFVYRENGELLGTVVATTDITPLSSAIRARDEFLQTVSHELRTPLTSILGYLEVIDDTIDVERAGIGKEFATVLRNSNRLLGLVDDLLQTADEDMPHYRRSVDVAALSKRAFELVEPAATKARIRLTPVLIDPVFAEIDEHQIGEVLARLLSNAIKFNRPGGEITIEVTVSGADVVVAISDTGYGVADEDLVHIFERFFRGAGARNGVVAGAGLGLSTAKLIVDSHHGSLAAESTDGEGTRLTMRLPLLVS